MSIDTFEQRSGQHITALTHQLREAFTDYAAELALDGKKLATLLKDKDILALAHDSVEYDVTDESCDFMLENADQLGLGDCLVLLEALGAEVNIMVVLPTESQKKLLTPKKQHRLQVARHLDQTTRKLQRKKE